jgi:hypothetical protein
MRREEGGMPLIEESRERQRLYAPSRLSLRGAVPAAGAGRRTPGIDGPWAADYPWRPEGQIPDYAEHAGKGWLIRGLVLAVTALANIGLASGSAAVRALVVLLDVCGVVVLLDGVLRIVHALRKGVLRVRWKTFPTFLGGRLEGTLVARPAIEPLAAVRAVLRCVRDERVVHAAAGGEEVSYEPMVLYQQISELPIPMDEMKVRELPLSFEVPTDLPGTDLGVDEPIYWQVALRIPMMGPDVETVFLAPVYARAE